MNSLLSTFEQISSPRLLVVGDIILDRYSWGSAERISPEAPVMVLKIDRHESRPGGAASVASLLRGLDVEVSLVGIVGDDPAGRSVAKLLHQQQIGCSGVVTVADRPTTTKQRLMGRAAQRHAVQILRVDEEVTDQVRPEIERELLVAISHELPRVDAVLVADYGKGVCTPGLLRTLIDRCVERRLPILVDPARGADWRQYRGASLLKPNRIETGLAIASPVDSPPRALQAAEELVRRFELGSVVVTLDCDGMAFATAEGAADHVPTTRRQVYDVTGAGDMALAVLGLTLASGIPLPASVHFANVASSLEVQRHGVTPVSRQEIRNALTSRAQMTTHKQVTLAEATQLTEACRRDGRRVVFTNGCFDLLHAGHVKCLQQAAALGDVLIVAVNSDQMVRQLKGLDRPVFCEPERVAVLSAMECVSHVLIFHEETPVNVLEKLRPHVLVKGGTYGENEVVGREVVLGYGGEVHVTDSAPGQSTTSIISRCRGENQSERNRFVAADDSRK
jgi:D-beta-D-heptose 7-phosphate kinase/D-beta-D-heptose 1-phosphate adenosyltransferase